ncbi:MAG: restriction endonuclease subunit S [Oscillospiraceae bacterium]|nr:restriction endonuclease subunit S [Oscillospiraceae bacterium]
MREFKKFRIGDLFDCLKPKCAFKTFNEQKQNVSKERSAEFSIPLTYAKKGDNGIQYYGRPSDWESYSNVLTVISNGVVATGLVYAQKNKTGVFGESYFLRIKGELASHKFNLYLAAVLEKVLYPKYSRENLAIWNNRVEDEMIMLPVTADGEIDFAFMENYIREHEICRLHKLEEYLCATDLDDCQLTNEEKIFLDDYHSVKSEGNKEHKPFRLGELFDISTPKRKFNANTVVFDGKYRYVARGESNNGIRGYITESEQYLNPANTISFGQDTATMFYQNAPYFTGDKIKIFSLKNTEMTREIAVYLIAVMKKAFVTFVWGQSSFSVNVLKAVAIHLPVTTDGNPDYEYMSTFIRIQQKLALKDVVEWKGAELKGI